MIRTRYADRGANDTANSDYRDLALLFACASVTTSDVIVDVGCGKGRAINWLLSQYPRNRIYGIELDPEICRRTATRLRRRTNVTIICGDATKVLPDDGNLFYLFNPFTEPVVRDFAAAVLRTASPRPTRVVYNNCKHIGVFEDDPRFTVHMVTAPVHHRSAIIDAPPAVLGQDDFEPTEGI